MLRLIFHCCLALLPTRLKLPLYRRLCHYDIGAEVRIGLSPILAARCRIGKGVQIGHFNLFWQVKELFVDEEVRIGHLNLFRGGDRIHLERFSEIIRMNVVNSILEADTDAPAEPRFALGAGSIITTGHWIDFTDRVTIGYRSIVGGRHSSIWTHSRQWTRPIEIGNMVYMGSDVKLAPGAKLPDRTVVALGSVVVERLSRSECLIGGNPAKEIKPLDARGLKLLFRKTRKDLPDDIGEEPSTDNFELINPPEAV